MTRMGVALVVAAGVVLGLPAAASADARVSIDKTALVDASGAVTLSMTVQCDAGSHFSIYSSEVSQTRGDSSAFTYHWDWGRFTCTGAPQTVVDAPGGSGFRPGRATASVSVDTFGACDWDDYRVGLCAPDTVVEHADTGRVCIHIRRARGSGPADARPQV